MVRVKICGITHLKDAKAAADFGADAIGFVFAESPRRISIQKAEAIGKAVGPWISLVGVFVNESAERILRIAGECRLSVIQLHGDESPGFIRKLPGLRIIKTLHVDGRIDCGLISKYRADAILLDTKSGRSYGGTGKPFDWKILKSKKFTNPLIISGGLTPGNVREAIKIFSPYGVDVSSGVEISPGRKDLNKMKEFIQNAKKI